MAIIDQANANGVVLDRWSFGGGTALMLSIAHRESHDVDLFIDDPQVLPLLNPRSQGYSLDLPSSDYKTDGTSALKIVFDGVGEIDFICVGPLTTPHAVLQDVRGRGAWVETPEEIVAKKIFHRGGRMQPRDMFDIAAVVRRCGTDGLVQALRPYRDRCEAALAVTQRFDPSGAEKAMGQLMIRHGFGDLPSLARADTIALLRSVLAS